MQEFHNSPHHKAKDPAAKKSQDDQQAALDTEHLYAKVKPRRTPGLRLFDIGLYPLLSNFAVFAVSVLFTFLTERGGDKRANGDLVYGKIGKFFQARGVWLEDKFQKKMGMSADSAKMGKIVFFSFFDGSLMAPLVKLLEDRREKIAYWIDEKLGTVPENMSPYEAEPKQSWWSVLGGRFLTAGIVVPIAMVLDKKKFYRPAAGGHILGNDPDAIILGSKTLEPNKSLNDILFNDPSVKHAEKFTGAKTRIGRFIEKITGVAPSEQVTATTVKNNITSEITSSQGNLAFATVAKMTYFEAFYTSVCTAGLYVSSRILATLFGGKDDHKVAKPHALKQEQAATVAEAKPVITPTKIEIPREPKSPEGRIHTQALETSRMSAHEAAPALQGI